MSSCRAFATRRLATPSACSTQKSSASCSSNGTDCDPTGQAGGYFQYFGTAAGEPTKGYYSFDIGGWHVVALNSNCAQVGGCGAGSAQETWLKGDLATQTWFNEFVTGGGGNYGGPKGIIRMWAYLGLIDYGQTFLAWDLECVRAIERIDRLSLAQRFGITDEALARLELCRSPRRGDGFRHDIMTIADWRSRT